MVPKVVGLDYEERLKIISLKTKRKRGDLLSASKLQNLQSDLDKERFLKATVERIRGSMWKL